MTKRKSYLLLIFLFQIIQVYSSKKVVITGKPGWVNDVNADIVYAANNDTLEGDIYYLLVDRQRNMKLKERFGHYTIKLLTSDGVKNNSSISVVFDPVYESVKFHKIGVYRNGKWINKLIKKDIQTFRREEDMERLIYDGRYTANINLKDIRKGDIIDYSYSVKGQNPVHKSHFFGSYTFNYSIPIKKIYNSLLIPEGKELFFTYNNGKNLPEISKVKHGKLYKWERSDTEPLYVDSNTPNWYNPYNVIKYSTFESWNEVAKLYSSLYKISSRDKSILKRKVFKEFGNTLTDSIIVNIIRFVQDDIRYLGMESGLGAFKPHSPLQVWNQRYGDCKDKSFLLSTILRFYNVDAFPYLVYSKKNMYREKMSCSPIEFDHCVVQITYKGSKVYIDPTISEQGGGINNIYFPDYGYGLVLDKNTEDVVLPKFTPNGEIKENWEYSIDSIGGNATIKVVTDYYGLKADSQRRYFSRNSLSKISKNYLDYYSSDFADLKKKGKIKYNDNRSDENHFKVVEEYFYANCWKTITRKKIKKLMFEFYPRTISDDMDVSDSPSRTMPYYIKYPNKLSCDITVKLPEDWTGTPININKEDDYFKYTENIKVSKNVVLASYSYQTKSGFVPADSVKSFIEKHKEAREQILYELTSDIGQPIKNNKDMSMMALLVFILLITIFISLAYNFYLKRENSYYIQAPDIGGWLIVIAIGITLTPLVNLISMFSFSKIFDKSVWIIAKENISNSKGIYFYVKNSVDLLYYSFMIIASSLLVISFYNKKRFTPKLFIVLSSITLGYLLLKNIGIMMFSPNELSFEDNVDMIKTISRKAIYCAIWIPYMIYSTRVKSTFVR